MTTNQADLPKSDDPFAHKAGCVSKIAETLRQHGVTTAILKLLPKNANDKNQIYIASDFGVLFDLFSMTFSERGAGVSKKKRSQASAGVRERIITEAVFDSFFWRRADGVLCPVKHMKAIIYPQYPEARLSGFLTVDNVMPKSLTVGSTKKDPDMKRLLVLGMREGGECVGIVFTEVSAELEAEVKRLPSSPRASACKILKIRFEESSIAKVLSRMRTVVSRPLPGCRLDSAGVTHPFTGTQVCGYTLEHALEIPSNAAKDGDLFGVELKVHTSPKLTLFTPEPDFGLYAEDFPGFMKTYGYADSDGDWRLTGIHRAGVTCQKTGLTLMVSEYRLDEEGQWIVDADGEKCRFPYDESTSLSAKADALQVVLLDASNTVAAGWSFGRLMNNWGVKHNEAVYVTATKERSTDNLLRAQGYEFDVTFKPLVMVCRKTSAEHLFKAINDGVVFLDPAPKLHATDPSKNKRRSQWRLNNILRDAERLYESVEVVDLEDPSGVPPISDSLEGGADRLELA